LTEDSLKRKKRAKMVETQLSMKVEVKMIKLKSSLEMYLIMKISMLQMLRMLWLKNNLNKLQKNRKNKRNQLLMPTWKHQLLPLQLL
jgi:hypothetical protein